MCRLAGRVQSSSGGAAAAGADGAVAAPLIGEPALPRGAPAAGGVFRRCGGRCRREGRAHGGGGAALTAADGGGEGPSAGRRSVAAIAVACRLAGPASGPRRSGLAALHGASRNSRPPPPLAPPPALSLGPASRPARDSPHAASPPPASHPRPRHLGPSAHAPARVPAADWRGDKAIEAEHMRWRRRPRLARDRRLAPLGSATIRGAPASARSRLPRTHPSRRRLLPPSPTLPLRPPPPLPRGAAPPLIPQPSRPSPLRAVTVTATVTVTVSPSRLSPCPSPRRPLHGARQRRRDASALAPPPPPPLGPMDAPRLLPPPAAEAHGGASREPPRGAVAGPAQRAGRRSPEPGGPSVGRGGRRGAAGPAQRWEGLRWGRPGGGVPVPCTEAGRRGVVRRGRCAVRPGPGARLPAPRGPSRFVSGVFGFVCSRCARFLVKTSHSVRICIPSPIPFGFGANRYDWGRSFPSVSAPRLVMVSPNQSGALRRTT